MTKNTPSNQYPHITVGDEPSYIGVDSFRNTIYVANYADHTVSVIDGVNNTKIGEDIKVGFGPFGIGVNSKTNTIYVANRLNDTVSVIDGKNNTKIGEDIKVGDGPQGIGVDELKNTIYVANYRDDTVSVIDGKNNTKIGEDIKVGSVPYGIGVVNGMVVEKLKSTIISIELKSTIYVANWGDNTVSVISVIHGKNNTKIVEDIKVGDGPRGIGVNENTENIYVANYVDDTVSVIDGDNNTKIVEDIKVGDGPRGIGVNSDTNTIYVANSGDDTVSVIDGKNNTKIVEDIKVGDGPSGIGVDENTKTIYVANEEDDTVSVIDGRTNKVVAKVLFNIEPFNSGHIECDKDKLIAPLSQQFYLYSNAECTAKPNQGFEFVSWQENLNGNSTQMIKVASSPSILDSILDFLRMKPDKPEATINITKFGSFTASFKALPSPIPAEYVATLFTVVITAFVGSWLTPTFIGWRKARNQGSKLDHYHKEIKNLYNDGRLDKNDIEKLNELRDNITDEYTRGKINKEQFDKLEDEISTSYREIFKNEIDSLNSSSEKDKANHLEEIKNTIEDAYATGKINELHHTLLKERLSSYEQNNL